MRLLLVLALLATAAAQEPKGYVCYRATGPIQINGRLNETAWRNVPWTEDFVDIEGSARPKPRFRTRAKMLWDQNYLYIGADMEEPHVWGTLTRHDSVIFHDNDFEVFIDPNGDNHEYYELEINVLNTTWDLFLPLPYKDGGKARNEWEIPGLKTAPHVQGTLNNPSDRDQGWSVEIALPWKALAQYAHRRCPPADGDQWRINFSRVEWQVEIAGGKYRKTPGTREDNWVWSPQSVINMHRPEKWGYVQFSTASPGAAQFQPDPTGPTRDLLHRVYYAQQYYRKAHGRWAASPQELELDRQGLTVQLTENGFQATARFGNRRLHIRQDSLVWEQ